MTTYAAVDQDTAAAEWYAALHPLLQTLVDADTAQIVATMRRRGQRFGELSALQLYHRVFVYTGEHQVKAPGKEQG